MPKSEGVDSDLMSIFDNTTDPRMKETDNQGPKKSLRKDTTSKLDISKNQI
jgi:hypothetical protein